MEKTKLNNIDYFFIENKKYKTNTISIFFKEKVSKEERIKRQILPKILLKKTQKYDSTFKLQRKFASMYSSNLSVREVIIGDYSLLKFSITFIQSKFLTENITNEVIDALYEVIYNPYSINEEFDKDTINVIKNEVKNIVKQKNQKKQMKAREEAFKMLYNDQSVNDSIITNEKIDSINAKEVYDYYQRVLKTNEMLIIFEGDEDIKANLNCFKSDLEFKHEYSISVPSTNPLGLVVENDDSKQNNIIFVYDGFSENNEDNIKNFFFAMMLGETPSSLLFKEVREKHSLAYSIGSMYDPYYKLLIIYGGVKLDSLDLTIDIVNKQLERLKTEDLSSLLEDIRQSYLNNLYASLDTKGFLTSRCSNSWVTNKFVPIEEVLDKINSITLEDVRSVAVNIQNKIMYVLQGELKDENK